ncbi:MAG TPA: hypothetical protein VJ044_07125 [Candidatus Hodarchaeales archaeon]|nr:hypothetical protein [Candidatus Hodarchaeales archaeon]
MAIALDLDLPSFVVTILLASLFFEAYIIAVLTIFNEEALVINAFTVRRPWLQSQIFSLLMRLFYILIAFFTLVGSFIIIIRSFGFYLP